MVNLDVNLSYSEELRIRKNKDVYFVYDKNIKKGINANQDLMDILELCNGENSVNEINYSLSRKRQEDTQEAVNSTIENLVKDGFLILNGKKEAKKKFNVNEYNFDFPLDGAYLELTRDCNFRCFHCYAEASYSNSDTNKTGLDQYKHLIDGLDRMGITSLCFTGGEPFFSRHVFDILPYVDSKNIEMGFLTNGALLNDESISYLKKINPKFVAVSCDSHKKEIFEKIRGKDNYKKVIESVGKLVSAGINTHINCVIFNGLNDSEEHISEFSEFFKKFNISGKSITFDEFVPEGRGKDFEKYMIDENKVAENIRNAFKKSPIDLQHEPSIWAESPYTNSTCGLGLQILSIKSNGDVSLCPILAADNYLAGNVFRQDVQEIWETSPVFKYFRENEFSKDKDSKCSKCDVLEKCLGGCKAKALRFYGSFSKHDPWMCAYFKK